MAKLEPKNELEAREILHSIRDEKGFMDAQTTGELEKLSGLARDNIEQTYRKYREIQAQYTTTYRFLFELIQNADDVSYSRAKAADTPPTVVFNLTRDRLIVELNEDGFTRANVEAICATGKSSKKKTALDDHIGEKGFGFKSVFAISENVHIQSGLWSFRFEHKEGQDGLGMVIPLDAEISAVSEGMTTRYTLLLANTSEVAYQELVTEIRGLDNVLFFIRQLQQISVKIAHLNGELEHVIIKKDLHLPRPNMITITRSTQFSGVSGVSEAPNDETDIRRYYHFADTVENLPKDARRQGRTKSRIEILLPVDDQHRPNPCELGEHVFAYLPLSPRIPQLPFLIQADFTTTGNRETIDMSKWNEALRNGIVSLFAKAISDITAQEHALNHKWLQFLPTKGMQHLWVPFRDDILKHLAQLPILQTRRERRLRKPDDLCILVAEDTFENKPLFEDLPDEVYLAAEYEKAHYESLKTLGVGYLTWEHLFNRLKADLRSSESKLRTIPPTSRWHAACASLLLELFEKAAYKNSPYRGHLKNIAIIPLRDNNQWMSSSGANNLHQKIYLPSSGGADVPTGLSLLVVDPGAIQFTERLKLFRELGVCECPQNEVRSLIQEAHRKLDRKGIDKAQGLFHDIFTHYGYLFDVGVPPEECKGQLLVPITAGLLKTTQAPLYFLSTAPHDTQQLLPEEFSQKDNKIAAFLDRGLVDCRRADAISNGITWLEWLKRATGARYFPALESSDSTRLSEAVLEIHRQSPQNFLRMLQAHWKDEYRDVVEGSAKVGGLLSDLNVPCESGEQHQIKSSYLPLPELKAKVTSSGTIQIFPFIQIPVAEGELDGLSLQHWLFLKHVKIRHEPGVMFYTLILFLMKDLAHFNFSQVSEVYAGIVSTALPRDEEMLRGIFTNESGICMPKSADGPWQWKPPSECLWEGPRFLTIKTPLVHEYDQSLERLFKHCLRIRGADVNDILKELEHRAKSIPEPTRAVEDVTMIYQYLIENFQSKADRDCIKAAFKSDSLIFANGDWRSLNDCIWKSEYELSGYQILDAIYPDLEQLFVGLLDVKIASPSLLAKDLIRLAKNSVPDTARIRTRLLQVGEVLGKCEINEELRQVLHKLQEEKILPISSTDEAAPLRSILDESYIPDHERYRSDIGAQCPMLDLSFSEVKTLAPFFAHFGFADYYLSTAVNEHTRAVGEMEEDSIFATMLQQRAYALYSCAAHHRSTRARPGDTLMFEQLSTLTAYRASEFSTELRLRLEDGNVVTVPSQKTLQVYYDEQANCIYTPIDKSQWRECFRKLLPSVLSKLIGAEGAKYQITLILDETQDLDGLLQDQDIQEVPWIPKPVIDSKSLRGLENMWSEEAVVEETLSRGRENGYTERTLIEDVRPPPPSDKAYATFLDHVIQQAQRHASCWSMQDLEHALSSLAISKQQFNHAEIFGNRDFYRDLHNDRIGTAGELFVFELLSGLGLPNFSIDNWRSNKRGIVRVVSKYSGLKSWYGKESGDLIYTDSDRSLTKWMKGQCEESFVAELENHQGPIRYLIEVKTTTGPCSREFYMAHKQFELMEDCSIGDVSGERLVYVLFRVYEVSSGDIGFRVFLDPWRLRKSELLFETTGQWEVQVR
ncbi:hypothetical protein EJ04DRAFT_549620 [Polyplosphaeria fusca]|uniref:Protein NO VEIN C-terminal domain-containing protein n=1 Tax=Polyplosphaeria fusca TaxID=682080 RepID=A0A9P4R5X7_9PLEO|nr:hypothetical protein EJ04DRAFT_549620 [Polyplosphaeria fusca]